MNNHKMEEGSGESAVSTGGFQKISKTTKILILVLVRLNLFLYPQSNFQTLPFLLCLKLLLHLLKNNL